MKYKQTNDTAIIEKDICLFCGAKLDYQNNGELDDFDEYNEPFVVQTRIIGVRCPNCGATHTAKFIVDKEDYVACNTDDWQVRVGSGFMNVYGIREEYNPDTNTYENIEFDYYMDCVSIYAELDEKKVKNEKH
jgi:hypothetical protein